MGLITAILLTCLAHYCDSQNPIRFTSSRTQFAGRNRVLLHSRFQWKTVSSPVICGRDCLLDPRCASFNYHISKRMCELNNVSRAHSPGDLLKLRESLYFDYSLDTGLLSVSVNDFVRYSDCMLLYQAGYRDNGVYTIYPETLLEGLGLQVYCDMETDGGGWIVFQRRQDGSVDFNRTWGEYQSGFGDLHTEFWLGNNALRDLTTTGKWKLRVDIEDWQESSSWAGYDDFDVEGVLYTLQIGRYYGPAGDALVTHKGQPFSTYDKDNDPWPDSCGQKFGGGWWFTDCFYAHLNGIYYYAAAVDGANGVQWSTWKGFNYSMKKCSMKIRQIV